MKIKMSYNVIEIEDENILTNDVTMPWDYNPHNIRLWVVSCEFGSIGAVWADSEQDAFDVLIDNNLGGAFLVDEYNIDPDIEYTYLGNASEPCNLDNACIEAVKLMDQDIVFLCKLSEAKGACVDNLGEL